MSAHPILLAAVILLASGCAESFARRMDYTAVDSRAMNGREMRYAVWTPPGFDPSRERLPLVVFLHGGGDDEASFDRFGLSARLDAAARAGRIPRVVIVLPEGELGFWTNWYDGSHRYEDWVVDEVMPRVAHAHRTIPCPEGCHVMGVSMGGAGTLRFALRYPDRWATATAISAPVLDTQQMIDLARHPLFVPIIPMDRIWGPIGERARIERDDPFARWRRPGDLGGTRLMVAWAEEDRGPIVETSRRLHRHLLEAGIPHQSLEFDGRHAWVSWKPVIEEALRRMVPPSPWALDPTERGDAMRVDSRSGLATFAGHGRR